MPLHARTVPDVPLRLLALVVADAALACNRTPPPPPPSVTPARPGPSAADLDLQSPAALVREGRLKALGTRACWVLAVDHPPSVAPVWVEAPRWHGKHQKWR